jgi:hypothetical protein
MPRNTCDRITPELPRAPINAPCDMAAVISATEWLGESATAL